jgi:hypothetical protein
VSLFGSIGNFAKKALKGISRVVDNPVTRAIGTVSPGVGAVVGMAGGIAGNRRAITGSAYPLTGFQQDPRMGDPWGGFAGGGATGYYGDPSGRALAGRAPMAGAAGSCEVRTLKSGKVRYPRRRADGTCYFPRRMNPLNPRAARRAIRRIKAVRRITRDIERSLPKAATRRRAA